MNNESKALELATELDEAAANHLVNVTMIPASLARDASAELRRRHAEIESLRAQIEQRVPDGWVGCVMVGHAKHHGGWCVFEETAPGEYVKIKGPFDTKELAQDVMLSAAPSQQSPHCATCNDNGLIGGPSYYAPDEGGVPCPDCSQQAPVPGEPVAWMVYQGVQPYQLCGSEKHAKAVADKNQKDHDLSGSLASFRVKPLFTHPQQASEPMTDADAKKLCAAGPVYAPNQIVDRTPAEYRAEIEAARIAGVRIAERHHKIGEKQ